MEARKNIHKKQELEQIDANTRIETNKEYYPISNNKRQRKTIRKKKLKIKNKNIISHIQRGL
jgi:hypothetical protein